GLDVLPGLVLDLGELEVGRLGVGEVDVADGAVGAADDLGHTAVAVAGLLTGRPVHGRAGVERPGRAGRRLQEVGEVGGRARAVGAVGDGDGRGRQLHAGVVGRDLGVVPRLDRAHED